MKVSQKGLYALKAMSMLARRFNDGAIRIRDIATEEELPEKFLELILLELKNARLVESVRGAKGGYRLRRPPDQINLAEIIRLIDGALAPFGDAQQLRGLIETETHDRALYQVFLDVRDAAARILENTTLADLIEDKRRSGRKTRKKEERKPAPAIVHNISKAGSRKT
jgi:Rrf2 family protein